MSLTREEQLEREKAYLLTQFSNIGCEWVPIGHLDQETTEEYFEGYGRQFEKIRRSLNYYNQLISGENNDKAEKKQTSPTTIESKLIKALRDFSILYESAVPREERSDAINAVLPMISQFWIATRNTPGTADEATVDRIIQLIGFGTRLRCGS